MAKKIEKKPVTKTKTKRKSKLKKESSIATGSTTDKQSEEPKPGFEDALDAVDAELTAGEKKDGRGGARPGAGRPKGVTEDFAAVNRLPEKANLTLVPVLQIPFKAWAKSVQLKEIELTKDEAEKLALPVTQLLQFYFPDRIPEIAWVWLMFAGTTFQVVEKRIELIQAKKKEAMSRKVSGGAGSQGPGRRTDPAPSGKGAIPASSYPKEQSK